jgi:outer membrane protein TolC
MRGKSRALAGRHVAPSTRAACAIVCATALLLAGCASFSADGGFDAVNQTAQQRINKEARWIRSDADADSAAQRVRELLQQDKNTKEAGLGADDAVQIALLNNPTLQASYAALGIAEADLVQAGRLPNPGFSFSRTHAGGDIKIDRSLSLAIMNLLSMPATSAIEQRRFRQTRLQLTDQMLRTAAQTREAWYRAVAAEQSLHYLQQVNQAAEAAHELAAQMAQRGNFSKLDASREQLFYAESSAQLARARKQAGLEREALLRALGPLPAEASGNQQPPLRLQQQLPALPPQSAQFTSENEAEQLALDQRLDVQAARLEVSGLQDSLGLTRSTRLINVLDLGYLRNSESGKAPEIGYQVSLEIPLFDWGQARVAKAEAIYMQSAQKLAAAAHDARSQVRSAYLSQRSAYQVARSYQQQIVPLRKRMSEENLLRYNGMLISVFDLLADAREQASTVSAAIEAARDFWIADSELQMAMGGIAPVRPVSPASTADAAINPAQPQASPHSNHGAYQHVRQNPQGTQP